MKKSLKAVIYILIALLALFVAATEIFGMVFSHDEKINGFISDTVIRVLSGICVMTLIAAFSFKTLSFGGVTARAFLALPCVLVVISNFPFYDWILLKPEIINGDYLFLFVAECLAVGFFEELLFRGLIFPLCLEKWNGSEIEIFKAVVASSALFGLFHIVNVFSQPFGAVALQVGYTFLIGMMMCFVMLYTECVWFCVILHAAFNFAGLFASTMTQGFEASIVTDIIIAAVAVIIALYCVVVFIKTEENFSKKFTLRRK